MPLPTVKPLKIGKTSELLFSDRAFLRRLTAINQTAGDQMLAMSWQSRNRDYNKSIECQTFAIFMMALFLDREKAGDNLAGD